MIFTKSAYAWNSGKRLEVINYERSEGRSSNSPRMSIVDRLCSTLAENFNSTYLCRLKKLLIHYVDLSFHPLFFSTHYQCAKEYFLLDIKDGTFPFFHSVWPWRGAARAGNGKSQTLQPTEQPGQYISFPPSCQMRTFFVACFPPAPNTYLFSLANNASALDLCNIRHLVIVPIPEPFCQLKAREKVLFLKENWKCQTMCRCFSDNLGAGKEKQESTKPSIFPTNKFSDTFSKQFWCGKS